MTTMAVREIPLEQIITDETGRQPPKRLCESLNAFEMRLPIYVREQSDGRYLLIEGSQRVSHAREAGRRAILANIRRAGPDDLPKDLEAILLNTQRRNLEQLFIARHARRLRADGYSQARIGRLIHRSEASISSMLTVLNCPDLVTAIESEDLQFGAARALAGLPPSDRQSLLREIRRLGDAEGKAPTVRRVEELARRHRGSASTLDVTLEQLPAVLQELKEEGVPIRIETTTGKRSQARAVLTLAEPEAVALRRFLEILSHAPQPPALPSAPAQTALSTADARPA